MTPLWALPLVVVMQTRSASVSPRPVVWASQSPRPSECSSAPGLWEGSRRASVERRCRDLARAQALLEAAPQQALLRAEALLAETPALPQARILRGRANLRLGNSRAALQDLAPLLDAGVASVADPAILQDAGRAAVRERDLEAGARFYRRLGSGAALLPERRQQVVAYVEIAAALLASEGEAARGGLEALAYLREARRRSAGSGYTNLVSLLTAYALIVQGRRAEGLSALTETRPREPEVAGQHGEAWLPPGLLSAIRERLVAQKVLPASAR